jgi:hypothetical protein
MKGKLGKTGIICLAVVLTLGIAGVGFGWWSEPVTIAGTANTGYLQLKLTDIECSNSNITCTQTGGGPEHDFTEFTIAVTDAYPGYVGRVTFDVTNTGTIPARIYSGSSGVFVPPWAEVHIDDVLVFGVQPMMPGESYLDRYIEVEIPAPGLNCPENAFFSFTLKIEAVQWNAP